MDVYRDKAKRKANYLSLADPRSRLFVFGFEEIGIVFYGKEGKFDS